MADPTPTPETKGAQSKSIYGWQIASSSLLIVSMTCTALASVGSGIFVAAIVIGLSAVVLLIISVVQFRRHRRL
ncbi:hypothetical protein [Cryobacterium soli]|uniref:hypothetical protein n=1 Tax=Cryobacterium soli TaxID=2220095 RepID=UPI0013C4CCDF|nr:hypothetical protein [Cryobacterium soli]